MDMAAVYARSFIALSQERGTSSSRGRWMEYERQLRDRDSSDSEDVIVRKPPCNLRTDHKYDCEDCREWRNLRYIKRGPKGAVWEKKWAPVVAQGPPPKNCAWMKAIAGCATQSYRNTEGNGCARGGRAKLAGASLWVRMSVWRTRTM